MRINGYTPDIHRLLRENPMITVGRRGHLHAVVPLDRLEDWTDAACIRWQKQFALPGLASVKVLPLDQFKASGKLGPLSVATLPAQARVSRGRGESSG